MRDVSHKLQHAVALLEAGRSHDALSALMRLLPSAPRDPVVNGLLAQACISTGNPERGEYYAQQALKAAPGEPGLVITLASSFSTRDRQEEAFQILDKAHAQRPEHEHLACAWLGSLQLTKRYKRAITEGEALAARFPDNMEVCSRLASALVEMGYAQRAAEVVRAGLRRAPEEHRLATELCTMLTYSDQATPQEVFEAHRAYGRLLQRLIPHTPAPFSNTPDPDRRIRVAFISPDFGFHPVGLFLEPLLAHLDRSRVDVYLYSTNQSEDWMTKRLRAHATQWRHRPDLTIAQHADLMRDDGVDVLFDVSGHTLGSAYPLFRLRPAPVQVSWLGFPNTSGLAEMDWRIVDSITDPDTPEVNALASERLYRLDPCFLCYRAPEAEHDPGVVEAPSLASGKPFTFGSFNSVSKIGDRMLALWARILRETPGSRLLLKYTAYAHEEGRALMLERFAEHAVEADRIELRPADRDYRAFLANYHDVDLALDTMPFNGATTTCDALFMGVPVLCARGGRCAARVASSILRAVGLDELVAQDDEGYVRTAREIATDPERLRALRAGLRERFLASPAGDAPAFAVRFEAGVREMWREWCGRARTNVGAS